MEVRYKWYFLRKSPLPREDPEQIDEGVDMQSECETDSLIDPDPESQDQEEVNEQEDEENIEEESKEVQEQGGSGEIEEGKEVELEISDTKEVLVIEATTEIMAEAGSHTVGDEQKARQQSERCTDTSLLTQLAKSATETVDYSNSELVGEGEVSKSVTDKTNSSLTPSANVSKEETQPQQSDFTEGDSGRQPWEMIDDPFIPLSIEQVLTCVCTRSKSFVCN